MMVYYLHMYGFHSGACSTEDEFVPLLFWDVKRGIDAYLFMKL